MTIKQMLFSLLMLSTATHILSEETPKNSPTRYDQSFELDISSLKNYKRSLAYIGVDTDDENISIYYKKTNGEESSFEWKGYSTTEIINLLRDAEKGILKRYIAAKYTAVYPKGSRQEIPCVFCGNVVQLSTTENEPIIIFDSTDVHDCKRLSKKNAELKERFGFYQKTKDSTKNKDLL